MKKIIYIFVFIIPFSAFAINQQEANAISEIIECKNTINDKDKLECFEKNIEKLEKVFPIATLNEKDRKIEIIRIEKEKKEDVFGVLQKDKTVDLIATRLLSDMATGLEITFHKAIDEVSSICTELDRLRSIQAVTNILTSGGADSAMEGSDTLKEMVTRYKGQLTIIAAGKISEQNIVKVHELIGAQEYHGRKIVGDLRPN